MDGQAGPPASLLRVRDRDQQHAKPSTSDIASKHSPATGDESELQRALVRLGNAVLRGALTGFCLRGGLHLVSLVFALLMRSRRRGRAKSLSPADQLRDTLRYTAFLGSFAGVFVSLDEGIASLFGKRRTSAWRAALAGAAAGPTLLLTGPKTRHTSLALYVLIRGITLLVRCGNKPDANSLIRRLLTPTRWQHGDTALMCVATSQIGYSWIMRPSTLPPSYVSFLNRHGGNPLHNYSAVRELAGRNAAGEKPGPLRALRHTALAGFSERTPCGFLHPGAGCTENAVNFLPQAYLRALPVYLPVYVLPALLVHRKNLVRPATAAAIWVKVARGAARSSLFLALYCTLAWRGACAGHQLVGTSTGAILAASCWTGGLATLAEKKSRRMELAFYCMSRAVESFALCLGEWGLVRRNAVPRRLDVLLFAAAAAAILHCYSDAQGLHRDVFRSKYLNVLDFILGSQGVEAGRIKHVPSASDLMMQIVPEAVAQDAVAFRQRALSFVGAMDIASRAEAYDISSPRSDASDRYQALDTDASQSLDVPQDRGPYSRRHLESDQGP